MHCDIFCRVIDNFGDIGICWRLAKQLQQKNIQVRLWVDDLHCFQYLCPSIDVTALTQTISEIHIVHWQKLMDIGSEPQEIFCKFISTQADLMIEAFACELPEAYVQYMSLLNDAIKPIWINLEYLSAESWIEACHLQQSPHPTYALSKTFFFPGFTKATGGLLREENLLQQRDAFLVSEQAQKEFWQTLHVDVPCKKAFQISLFCYDNPGLIELFNHWAQGDTEIICYVPYTQIHQRIAQWLGENFSIGKIICKGRLTLYALPFLSQEQYDQLLWLCDFNFVRGEDSFVRAQWANKPFVWHIYAQEEQVHIKKLNAFLERYLGVSSASSALMQEDKNALYDFWMQWNNAQQPQSISLLNAWEILLKHQMIFLDHAQSWGKFLCNQMDLTTQLIQYYEHVSTQQSTQKI